MRLEISLRVYQKIALSEEVTVKNRYILKYKNETDM